MGDFHKQEILGMESQLGRSQLESKGISFGHIDLALEAS